MAPARFASETGLARRENLAFEVLCLLEFEPGISQRELARRLHISLGRMNYCMKALIDEGLVSYAKFEAAGRKRLSAYELTPAGFTRRSLLAEDYLQRKLAEFDRLKTLIEMVQSGLCRGDRA